MAVGSGDRKWMDGISLVCVVLQWDVAPVKLSRLLANMLLGVGCVTPIGLQVSWWVYI